MHLTILALIFVVLLATILVQAEAAPTFSVGRTADIQLDRECIIDITIDDMDMPEEGLNTFGCTVTFTHSEVEVTGVAAGEWHDPEGNNTLFAYNIDNEGGTVTFGGGMAEGGYESGILATLIFRGIGITKSFNVKLEVFGAKESTWTDIVPTVSSGTIEVYQQYTLTIGASEGGTTTPAVGTHLYKAGKMVFVTATPNTESGYRFRKWTIAPLDGGEGINVSDTTTNVVMNANKTAQAYFYLPEVKTIKVSGDTRQRCSRKDIYRYLGGSAR